MLPIHSHTYMHTHPPTHPRRVLLHGVSAIGCILMFWMGEITSPLFNTFTISRELRHLSKAAFQIFSLAGPLFTGG